MEEVDAMKTTEEVKIAGNEMQYAAHPSLDSAFSLVAALDEQGFQEQLRHQAGHPASSGLRTARPGRFRTWVPRKRLCPTRLHGRFSI
jgi:hypothetical protein